MTNKPKRHLSFAIPEESWRFAFLILLALGARAAFISDSLEITPIESYGAYRIAQNLGISGHFGVGPHPDAAMGPLLPWVSAAAYKIFSLPVTAKPFAWINLFFDFLSVLLLARVGIRCFGPAAALGLVMVVVSPLWIGHVTTPTTHSLALMLIALFCERWTVPERSRIDEAVAGVALGLLALAEPFFALFALLPFGLSFFERIEKRKGKKRRLPSIGFLAIALLLPTPWLLRNAFVVEKWSLSEMAFSPNFGRLADLWYWGWMKPLPGVYVPEYFAPIYLWVFLGFVSILGAVGLLLEREGGAGPVLRIVLSLAAYVSIASMLLPVDPHFSLVFLALAGLGAGVPLLQYGVFPQPKGRAAS